MHIDPGSIRFFLAVHRFPKSTIVLQKATPTYRFVFWNTGDQELTVSRELISRNDSKKSIFLQDARFLSQNFVFNN